MAKDRPPPRTTLAKNLEALMVKHEMSGPAVAKAAGIDRKSVNNMRHARHNPDLDHVEAVARVFGLTAWQLIRTDLSKDIPAAKQIDWLIERFYAADEGQRATIMQVAEMAGPYKAK